MQYVQHHRDPASYTLARDEYTGAWDFSAVPTYSVAWAIASTTETLFLHTAAAFVGFTVSFADDRVGLYRLLAVESDADRDDVEVLVPISYPVGATTTRSVGVGVRGSGAHLSESVYFAYIDRTAGQVGLAKKISGTTTVLDTASVTVTEGYDYYLRMQAIGTALKARVWRCDATEPTAWDVEATDASISAAGWVGFLGYNNTGGVALQGWVNCGGAFISVGTNGDAAPMPRTLRQYLDWLARDGEQRVVLCELGVLGQTSGGSANPSRVCVATHPFVSHPTSDPANVCYDDIVVSTPNFRIRAPDLGQGRSSIGYGDLVVKNELDSSTGVGLRDDWLTWNWDGRPYVERIGGIEWPLWDFMQTKSAAIESVFTPALDLIGFKIRDGSMALNRKYQTAVIGGTGPYANQPAPNVFGRVFNIEPVLEDAAQLRYRYSFAWTPAKSTEGVLDVRDSGVTLSKSSTVSAVNAGTDTITATAHGGVAGSQVEFTAGTPPAPLALNTVYYIIASGLTANDFKLSTTIGGGAIDITGTTTGATALVRNWQNDYANGRITLLTAPVGQITMDVWDESTFTDDTLAIFITALAIIFGVSVRAAAAGQGSPTNFAPATGTAGLYLREDRNVLDLLDEFTSSGGGFWFFDRSGALGAAQLVLPQASYEYDLQADDVAQDLRLEQIILPSEVQQLGYARNWTKQDAGLAGAVSATDRARYASEHLVTGIAPVYSGLDQPANHELREIPRVKPTLIYGETEAELEAERLDQIRRKTLGIFSFTPLVYQTFYTPGERVRLTHPRYGFEAGRVGVILGIEEDARQARTRLTIITQLDGQFPTTDSTAIVPETYFY